MRMVFETGVCNPRNGSEIDLEKTTGPFAANTTGIIAVQRVLSRRTAHLTSVFIPFGLEEFVW